MLVRKGVFNLFRRLKSESKNLFWLLLSVKNVHLVVCVIYLPSNIYMKINSTRSTHV